MCLTYVAGIHADDLPRLELNWPDHGEDAFVAPLQAVGARFGLAIGQTELKAGIEAERSPDTI
jgi:hypothetical protein